MQGWGLALSAAGLWSGVLLAGLGERGPGSGWSVALLVLGIVPLGLVIRGGRLAAARVARPAMVLLAFSCLGAGWSGLREARLERSPLAGLADRSVSVLGTLSSDPQGHPLGWTAMFQVDVVIPAGLAGPGGVRPHESVWLEGEGHPPSLDAGDRLGIDGVLEGLHGDFGAYLRRRGIPASLHARQITRLGPPSNPVLRLANGLRSSLHASLLRVFPDREAGLVMGLALGDTSRLDPHVDETFRATGLSHLTAVSGENVAMFLAPILGLAAVAGLGRRSRFALGLGSVLFFVLLTRAEPSVLRAAVMAGLTMLGVFLGRPRSPPAILGGAVLVLLAFSPTLVYAIGFQLSVAATTGMAALAGPLSRWLRRLPEGLALAAAATIGAQAGVTPLLLYHFGVVPTVSIPANLLAFPAVGLGMLLGLAAAVLGLIARPVGVAVAGLAVLPLRYLEALAGRLARSPLPSVTSGVGRLPSLVAGLALMAAIAWWIRTGRHAPRRAILACTLALPILMWVGAARAGPPADLTVTFIDVGWGDGALIRSPGGATILIDGGSDPELVATRLAAFGVRRLDVMVATHPHADHVGGLPAVLARFPVALILDPGCPSESPYYRSFVQAVRASGVPMRRPSVGDVLQVGDVRLHVLGPEHCFTGTHSDANNDSVVLLVSQGGNSVLFPGDAEWDSQKELLRDELAGLPALVLKVPHHGGNTSLDEFFRAVGARVAVVSVGPNRYGHPAPEVMAMLTADGMRTYRTDYAGGLTITFHGGRILVHEGHPCRCEPGDAGA